MSPFSGQRGIVSVYAHIYGRCMGETLKGLRKNAWTLLLPIALLLAYNLLQGMLVLALGRLSGFVVGFVMAAAGSCYLYFLGEIITRSRTGLRDFGQSIKAYFWSVVNLLFVIWIASFVVGSLLGGTPQGGLILTGLYLVALVLFNAAPEVIYQRGTYGGLATFQRSLQFLQESWIEWGVPNLVGIGLLYIVLTQIPNGILSSILAGALLHVLFVFRGYLFQELDGSSHRQRMFKYRAP